MIFYLCLYMASDSLHLKYRPQQLPDLVGQPIVQTCLSHAIQSGKVDPAYLFAGPRGTGKTSTARILAKSLNCQHVQHPTLTPCGVCHACRAIETGSSLDVIEMDCGSKGGVDDARELVLNVQMAPVEGRYRVVILDESHLLSPQAQSALLKVIEEPPPRVVFILCTTELHKVLPTIVSRCLAFEFNRISPQVLQAHLQAIATQEAIAITPDACQAIARLCGGGLRDALQILAKAALVGKGEIDAACIHELAGSLSEAQLLEIVGAIAQSDVFALLLKARELINSGKTPQQIHTHLLELYRDLLLLQHSPPASAILTSVLTPKKLLPFAQMWSSEQVHRGLSVLHEAEQRLRFSPNAQVWLETCLLGLLDYPPMASTPVHSAPNPIDPDALWQEVLVQTPPKAKVLLQHVRLIHLDGKTAVLEVSSQKATTLERHEQKVARLIEQVLGYPVQLQIRVLASVN